VLVSIVEQIKALSEQIAEQLDAHADAHIFTSLPRSGTVRAARLLAEISDCHARFPTPEALACLAGVAPSTASVRQVPRRRVPLGRRQATPRRRLRLRQRPPPGQPLGPTPLPAGHRPRTRPSPCRPDPRPRLLYVIWHC